jgi:hypothetical protein
MGPAVPMKRSRAGRSIWLLTCVALLSPSVGLASGDPGLVWQALCGLAAYATVAGVIVFCLARGTASSLRLILFGLASLVAWYLLLNSRPPNQWYEFCAFLLVPAAFLIGLSLRRPGGAAMIEAPVILRADDPRFATRAKDLLYAKTSFRFVVAGPQADAFRPYLVNGQVIDAYKMGVNRILQPILGVLLIAEGVGRPVRFSIQGDQFTGTVLGVAREDDR